MNIGISTLIVEPLLTGFCFDFDFRATEFSKSNFLKLNFSELYLSRIDSPVLVRYYIALYKLRYKLHKLGDFDKTNAVLDVFLEIERNCIHFLYT